MKNTITSMIAKSADSTALPSVNKEINRLINRSKWLVLSLCYSTRSREFRSQFIPSETMRQFPAKTGEHGFALVIEDFHSISDVQQLILRCDCSYLLWSSGSRTSARCGGARGGGWGEGGRPSLVKRSVSVR